jgi:hypothetical protein
MAGSTSFIPDRACPEGPCLVARTGTSCPAGSSLEPRAAKAQFTAEPSFRHPQSRRHRRVWRRPGPAPARPQGRGDRSRPNAGSPASPGRRLRRSGDNRSREGEPVVTSRSKRLDGSRRWPDVGTGCWRWPGTTPASGPPIRQTGWKSCSRSTARSSISGTRSVSAFVARPHGPTVNAGERGESRSTLLPGASDARRERQRWLAGQR